MLRLSRPTFLVLVLAVAFLVRLGTVLALRDVSVGPVGPPTDDAVEFNNLARNLVGGAGYANAAGRLTSFRAPGWPIFLAGLYLVAGQTPWLVYAVNCLLGALTCWLTYLLGRELLDEWSARVAALLAALYLPTLWFATMYLSENLFVPCLALAVLLFARCLRSGSVWLVLATGLVLGWAVLTRPFALLLVPCLLLILLRAHKGSAPSLVRRLLPAGVLAAAVGAVVLPWTVRNYLVHRQPVLVATNGGSTFYGGNNGRVARERRYLGYWLSTTELPHRDRVDAAPNEVAHDKVEWALGWQWVREHPGEMPLLLAAKVVRLVVWPPDFDGGPRLYYAVRVLGYAPYLLLFLLGGWCCLRRPELRTPGWQAIHATLLATLLTGLIFWGSARFRDANAPLLMLYAAVGLGALCRWRARTTEVLTNQSIHEVVMSEVGTERRPLTADC
jgi:4-amino-4-deoxy-L-arabinose transferase-like glycosyltransferase